MGTIAFDGTDILSMGPAFRQVLGFMPQSQGMYDDMTAWEFLLYMAQLKGLRPRAAREQLRELLQVVNLWDAAHRRVGGFSGGMRQRCALIRTLAPDPRILLLDEPFSALDYQTRLSVSADIYRIIRQEGKTALLVTHDISEAISMSDRVAVLTRRPARVKAVHDMGPLRGLPPMERRDTPEFHTFFNAIWKELELHDG